MQFIIDNFQVILIAIVALLTAVIGILVVIPGEQGESVLTKIRDFIGQFVKKS